MLISRAQFQIQKFLFLQFTSVYFKQNENDQIVINGSINFMTNNMKLFDFKESSLLHTAGDTEYLNYFIKENG